MNVLCIDLVKIWLQCKKVHSKRDFFRHIKLGITDNVSSLLKKKQSDTRTYLNLCVSLSIGFLRYILQETTPIKPHRLLFNHEERMTNEKTLLITGQGSRLRTPSTTAVNQHTARYNHKIVSMIRHHEPTPHQSGRWPGTPAPVWGSAKKSQ